MNILTNEAHLVCLFLLARSIWCTYSYERDPFGLHILSSDAHLVCISHLECIFLSARPICCTYPY